MTTVIYHANCDDGFGSALAAWLKFGDGANYFPSNYGDPVPTFNRGDDVYILDFSYSREVTEEIGRRAGRVVLLDHHKTAKENLAGLELECEHYININMEKSGALLTWEFFFQAPPPKLFEFIDDNDRWQFKLPETRYIIRNLRSYEQDFEEWERVLKGLEVSHYRERFIEEGIGQERFFQSQVDFLMNMSKPHPVRMLGDVEGLAMNATRMYVSDLGHRLAVQSGTYGLVWSMLGPDVDPLRQVVCSLRSNGEFDVTEIAKIYGGGGHRNAAGFETSLEAMRQILA